MSHLPRDQWVLSLGHSFSMLQERALTQEAGCLHAALVTQLFNCFNTCSLQSLNIAKALLNYEGPHQSENLNFYFLSAIF